MPNWKIVSILNLSGESEKSSDAAARRRATFDDPKIVSGRCVAEYISPDSMWGKGLVTSEIAEVYCDYENVFQFRTQNHIYTFVRGVE